MVQAELPTTTANARIANATENFDRMIPGLCYSASAPDRTPTYPSAYPADRSKATLERNDGWRFGQNSAISRRHAPEECWNFSYPQDKSAQGMPDAKCTRSLACEYK